jgi:outer membrane protein assembly factor BamE (lipoprotein component of BamABCDE complex)
MLKNLFILLLAGLFLGCSTTAGRQFNTSAADHITPGITTESDVLSMLGAPLTKEKVSGTELYTYNYACRVPLVSATKINTLQLQIAQGVVVNKWSILYRWD